VNAEPDVLAAAKAALRRDVLALRRAQPEKDALSDLIASRLSTLTEFQAADVVMFYVDARSEVRTRSAISAAIASGKTGAVPQCVGDELVPWRIASLDDLTLGTFGIAEPSAALCLLPGAKVDPRSIDLVVVPGVAFDRRGQRLGTGRGYYDRFLRRLRSDATLVGLAFDCQIVDAMPAAPHDVPMHIVITPTEVIRS
jgi:5-formyltetrahydrofolate cyclo-ligase